MMSWIDVAIPATLGLLMVARPRFAYFGSKATPDAKKLRMIRGFGGLLLLVAALYLGLRLAGS